MREFWATTRCWDCIEYPGGEVQMRLRPQCIEEARTADAIILPVKVRTTSGPIKVLQMLDALRGLNGKARLKLYMPYLPYARADRRFVEGDCRGLEVFGALTAFSEATEIHALDVHNPQAASQTVSHLVNHPARNLILRTVVDFAAATSDDMTLLFPDEGAQIRYDHLLDLVGADKRHATKRRDPATGKLSGFEVPKIDSENVLVVDDICDGGGTFLGIAEKLMQQPNPPKHLGLYATHGIFSKGFEELEAWYSHIYTTDSWLDSKVAGLRQNLKVWSAFEAIHNDRGTM